MFLKPFDTRKTFSPGFGPIEIIKTIVPRELTELKLIEPSRIFNCICSTSPCFHYTVMFPQRSNLPWIHFPEKLAEANAEFIARSRARLPRGSPRVKTSLAQPICTLAIWLERVFLPGERKRLDYNRLCPGSPWERKVVARPYGHGLIPS